MGTAATHTRIEKAAVDNGFDQELPREGGWLGFASSHAPPKVWVTAIVEAALPRSTEAERLVVQKMGQDLFRGGLLEYWEGRCALTGREPQVHACVRRCLARGGVCAAGCCTIALVPSLVPMIGGSGSTPSFS
jgi:hypothetical protein